MLANPLRMLLAILMATPASGQQTEPTPAPDFSAGFARLAALGLPALDARAQWSTFPNSYGQDNYGDYEAREILKSLKGNGWSLPSDTGKPLGLPAGAVATVDLSSEALAANAPPRGLLSRIFGGGTRKPAAVPAADLTKDVRALIAALRKEDDGRDPFSFRSSGTVSGKLLLLATQIHQNGKTALANELAMTVFDLTASRESAVDAAVSILADHAYESAAQAFFSSYDWKAYHRSLTELVAKFPRGWSSREAVAMLLPQLAKQAAGEKPAAPSLPSIPLDPKVLDAIQQLTAKPEVGNSATDDEKLAKLQGVDLASLTPQMRQRVLASLRHQGMQMDHSSSLWLLEPPGKQPVNASPLTKITTLGIQALPALAALVDDPWFTCVPNVNARNGSSYYSSNEDDAERISRIHARLNRPSTRGELACSLLKSTLPDDSNNSYDSNETAPQALRELALAFWKENQHATRDELAAVFLRDGSPHQVQAAATLLASSADPKAHQAFESHILAADPAIAQFQCVKTYLSARKATAKPFLEAYAKLVRSQATDAADEDNPSNAFSYAIKQAGGTEKILKQLGNLVTGISPLAIAKEIANDKPAEAQAAIQALLDMMKDETPVKRLNVLLEGALAAEDPAIRCRFLEATYGVIDTPEMSEGQGNDLENEKPPPSADRPLPEAEIKIWQQLIADTRKLPKDFGNKTTVADLAASALVYSINPEYSRSIASDAPILQKTVSELFRENAAIRLAGKPVPPLPDATRVTPARLRAIITEAGARPAPDIHPYLATLTSDERAAWIAWTLKPGDISVPPSVKDLRLLVIARNENASYFPDVKGAGNIDIGFSVTPANLRAYVNSLAKDINKHSRTTISIQPASFGPGLEVLAQVIPLPQKAPDTDTDAAEAAEKPDRPDRYQPDARSFFHNAVKTLDTQESAEAVILIFLPNRSSQPKSTIWLVEKGKAKPVDPEQQTSLDAALQALAEAPESMPFFIRIQILTKADADIITESSRN